jgi:hypothetical protein
MARPWLPTVCLHVIVLCVSFVSRFTDVVIQLAPCNTFAQSLDSLFLLISSSDYPSTAGQDISVRP